ncbi:hypoxia up-regulated protein 1 [Planococcus citri]|uniref:hypoxia up-regulated protein 1 n=1 Tax=Planococcus citri TaxID=170843 RepID=UPI0031F9E9C5
MSATSRGVFLTVIVSLAVFFHRTHNVESVAVMSVDIGLEWMKVAIVSPGVPMEIALNKESKRKTPVAIAFRDNERTFGEDALSVGVRFPSYCFTYFLDLLGKDINNPIVKQFQERFPQYDLRPDPHRNTVVFHYDNETVYSPEELVAMLLSKAREFAKDSARQPINDVVLTVPGYFNQIERKAMITAAEMAGLKVLQLINDYTAAALNYGIFRRKDFNDTAQYVMLYDMGASSTSAVVVSYQNAKTKEKGFVETNPQLSIVGVGYDRTLGGLEMQLRLRDFLAKKFNELKKTNKNVFEHPRAMAKLFKEAGRLKIILSANAEYYAQVENVMDDVDFKLLVTREEFENLCADLFARVKSPVEQALKTSQLSMDVISQVILVGAGTRVPAVQDQLSNAVKIELSKNLNTDEAAVLGAAYKAADLSTGFKVKKFITKDAVIFPIQVTFEREKSDVEKESKQITRTLFNLMNPYPQKKILTFNKHQNDFEFRVQYGDLESLLPEHEIQAIGGKSLHAVRLNGVSEAIKKHHGANIESKGIKAHFNLDESGLLSMTNVEYIVEKTLTAEELAAQEYDEQSTFSKLSSTISKLFHAAEEELKEKDPNIKIIHKDPPSGDEGTKPVKEEPEPSKPLNETDKASNKTETDDAKKVNATVKEEAEKKPKVVTLKEPINSSVTHLGVNHLSGDQLQQSVDKINVLDEYDLKRSRREGALNALESAVIDTRMKLDDADFISYAKPEESELITTKSKEISDWLEEEGYTADVDVLESKLSELKKLMKPVKIRHREHTERPEALKALDQTLNSTTFFLNSIKNFTQQFNATSEDPAYTLYTTVEIQSLEKLINDTIVWKETAVTKQSTLAKSDDPVFNVRTISEKSFSLDREVRYLANKSKNWRPPPSDKGSKDKDKKSKSKSKGKETEESSSTQEEKPVTEDESNQKPIPEKSADTKKEDKSTTSSADNKEDLHAEL